MTPEQREIFRKSPVYKVRPLEEKFPTEEADAIETHCLCNCPTIAAHRERMKLIYDAEGLV